MNRETVPCANCGRFDAEPFLEVPAHRKVAFIAASHSNVICRHCGLVYISPRHPERDYIRFYESTSYSEPIRIPRETVLRQQRTREGYVAYIKANLPEDAAVSGRVRALDIGCSMGVLPYLLKREGYDVHGLEPSHFAGQYAQETFGIPISKGFLSNAALGTFDLVTSTAVVEHLIDPLAGIRDMSSMVRPGGYLYLSTPDLRGAVLRSGNASAFPFVHLYNFTLKTLSSLVQQAGLKIVAGATSPPELGRSSWVYPGDFDNGRLHVLARKEVPEGESVPLIRDDFEDLFKSFREIERRDRIHRWIHGNRFVNKILNRTLRKWIKPRSAPCRRIEAPFKRL